MDHRYVAANDLALEIRSCKSESPQPARVERVRDARFAVATLPPGPDSLLVERCSLRGTETALLWTLVALACSEKALRFAIGLGVDRSGAVTVSNVISLLARDADDGWAAFSV